MKKYILLLAFIGCNHSNNQKISHFNPVNSDSIGIFKERTVNIGDTVAYNNLSLYYTFQLTHGHYYIIHR